MTTRAYGTIQRLSLRLRGHLVSTSVEASQPFERKAYSLKADDPTSTQRTEVSPPKSTSAIPPATAAQVIDAGTDPSGNDLSGTSRFDRLYSSWAELSGEVELSRLKSAVTDCSAKFDESVRLVSTKRVEVDEAHRLYDEAQKRYAHHMMKRDHWDASDASLFIQCTSDEVACRQQLQRARESLRKAEDNAGRHQREYMDAMRKRYHEEQMWQDKWRVAGTFGTWSLIALNTIIFMGGQYFHIRREKGRLQGIEDLINSKFPSAEIPDIPTESVKEVSNFEVESQNAENVSTEDSVNGSDRTKTQSSTTSLSDQEKKPSTLQKMWQVTTWLLPTKDAHHVGSNDFDWSSATNGIHWPSAVVGAAIATTGMIALSMCNRR